MVSYRHFPLHSFHLPLNHHFHILMCNIFINIRSRVSKLHATHQIVLVNIGFRILDRSFFFFVDRYLYLNIHNHFPLLY
ncbi:hypothetical protein GDO86_016276 [Hymenochirus boettgeri]|uniref:Uncharacterized protein n=1 Tax=Hymenochirus boettgeri TaxID=247094 RepID=A0A8T2K1E1_9PIPI|nr:hypothetical protein GDO86_016276 [Hymenochirus boettgeri]